MKTLMTATAVSALMGSAAFAEDIKLGVIYGFTGPIESLTGPMAAGAELAMKEVTDSGLLLDGSTVTSVRADSTCIDSAEHRQCSHDCNGGRAEIQTKAFCRQHCNC